LNPALYRQFHLQTRWTPHITRRSPVRIPPPPSRPTRAEGSQKPCKPADRDLEGHRTVAFVVELHLHAESRQGSARPDAAKSAPKTKSGIDTGCGGLQRQLPGSRTGGLGRGHARAVLLGESQEPRTRRELGPSPGRQRDRGTRGGGTIEAIARAAAAGRSRFARCASPRSVPRPLPELPLSTLGLGSGTARG
jgi:hypothetical protein